jgi:hypothetical protein
MTAGHPRECGKPPPSSPRAKIDARQQRQNVVVRANEGGAGVTPSSSRRAEVTLKAIKFAQRLVKPPAIAYRRPALRWRVSPDKL